MTATMHPPVLLVPGWSDTARSLRHAERFLLRSGWPATHVRSLSFRDRYGCNSEHAAEIGAAVEELLQASGGSRAAVVAHSMGGLALRSYLLQGGDERVETAIFAGTPHAGTWVAYLAWGAGGPQMRPGSAFLRELAAQPLPERVKAWCLRTPLDLRILPGRSAWLEGAGCVTVRALRHQWLLRDRRSLETVRRLLTGG